MSDKVISTMTSSALYGEAAEKVRSGSMGGHDPEAKQKPVNRLVKTFGKWADGRFSKCVRVLSKHPELVAAGGGNVNRLCAWLKDQWAGTTKWRGTGPKQKAEDKIITAKAKARHAAEAAYFDGGEPREVSGILIPAWAPSDPEQFNAWCHSLADMFDNEMAREAKEGYDPGFERDDDRRHWGFDRDDDMDDFGHYDMDDEGGGDFLEEGQRQQEGRQALLVMDARTSRSEGETSEAVSFDDITSKVRAYLSMKDRQARIAHRLRAFLQAGSEQSSMVEHDCVSCGDSGYQYSSLFAVYDSYFVYKVYEGEACEYYMQRYSVTADGSLRIDSDPAAVTIEWQEVTDTDDGGNEGSEASAASASNVDASGATAPTSDEGGQDGDGVSDPTDEKSETGEKPVTTDGPESSTPPETAAQPSATPSSDHLESLALVAVRYGRKTYPVLVGKGRQIVRGPKALVGSILPPMPRTAAATAAEAQSSKTAKASVATASTLAPCMSKHMKAGKSFVEARALCIKEMQGSKAEGKEAKSMKLGGGGRYEKLVAALKKKGAKNPEALAASIGRKKYGKGKFQKMASSAKEGRIYREGETFVMESTIVMDGTGMDLREYTIDDEFSLDTSTAYVDAAESTSTAYEVVEQADGTKKVKTPAGREVDAIVRVIVPGPGNSADGFYYPAEAIRRDIRTIAEGQKMYKNHLTPQQEAQLAGRPRSVDEWVATIEEAWTDDEGRGYGGVSFVDEDFHKKAKRGFRHMGVSIRSRVKARPGTVDGKTYRVVESFVQGRSVDFVTEAGAGGGFEQIAESNREEISMGKFDGATLEELLAERPDLIEAVENGVIEKLAEEMNNGDGDNDGDENKDGEAADDESKAEGESDGDEGAEGGESPYVTKDDLKSLLSEFKDEILGAVDKKTETTESIKAQQAKAREIIAGSRLRDTSKDALLKQFADVSYDGDSKESGVDKMAAAVTEAVEARTQEIRAYFPTRVVGLGAAKKDGDGEESTESSKDAQPAWSANAEIDRLMGTMSHGRVV